MKNFRLFFDLKSLPAQTLRVVGNSGSVRAVRVFELLKKRGFAVTYKAVVKRLNDMAMQGMLIKEGLDYSVNKEWLSETKEVFDDLDYLRQ